MLVLHRAPKESVTIFLPDGRTIVAEIVSSKDSGTHIGWTADRDIPIHRTEITQKADFVHPLATDNRHSDLLTALRRITEIQWGWDGDCGAVQIAQDAINEAEAKQ